MSYSPVQIAQLLTFLLQLGGGAAAPPPAPWYAHESTLNYFLYAPPCPWYAHESTLNYFLYEISFDELRGLANV